MIDYTYANLFLENSIDKQLILAFSGGETITNEDIYSESMELTESLCSESELTFGACEASVFKIKIANSFVSHVGQKVTVSEILDGNIDEPFVFGTYTVISDKPTADRKHREITAYDSMYDIINAEVSDWYNELLPDDDSKCTLLEFRTSFMNYFGIEQEDAELINDSMIVEKTIEPSELSGNDVIRAVCEINGCFGHIGRNGKFQYVHLLELIQGLYPANDLYPADDLYPSDPVNSEKISRSHYISCEYEDFETQKITKLQIRQEEDDIGAVYPDTDDSNGDNCYIVQDNFLVYGKDSEDLETIAENLFSMIGVQSYRPASIDAVGNPCLMVGDGIRLVTTYEIIYTYILQRTLTGIQALSDNYDAEGVETYEENVNGVNASIVQLKGKTNTLTRTVEETQSQIVDVEEELSSTITQTASEIRTEISNTADSLSSEITQTASEIRTEVENTADGLQSQITQTASEIRTEISNETDDLQSQITQNANNILLKVDSGDVCSEINQSSDLIKLKSNRLVVESTNFTLDENGIVTLKSENNESSNFYTELSSGNIKSTVNSFDSGIGYSISYDNGSTTYSAGHRAAYSDYMNGYNGSKTIVGCYSENSDENGLYIVNGSNVVEQQLTNKQSTTYLLANKLSVNQISGTGTYSDPASNSHENAVSLQGNLVLRTYYDSDGNETIAGAIYCENAANSTTSKTANGYINPDTGHFGRSTSSSKRYKHNISTILSENLTPEKLYNLPIVEYVYNLDYLSDAKDTRYNTKVIGFLAEDMDKYYPIATDYNEDGSPENWSERYIIPAMLYLIQKQNKEIEQLRKEIETIKIKLEEK